MQATAADSVAVKTPERMPPRMMTMVTRPQTESSAIFRESRSEIGSPRGKLRFLATRSTSTNKHRPKRGPGKKPVLKPSVLEKGPPAPKEMIYEISLGRTRIH